jgi:hypothetical protein
MLLLILAIASVIGLIISVTKSIRFLGQEDTKSSSKWAWIAVSIVLVYALFALLYKKLFPDKTTILEIGRTKYKLKANEVRSSGKPESNFDLIANTAISKTKNRRIIKVLDKVNAYITSDPDFNADGKIMMGFASAEISFSDNITLTEDLMYEDSKAILNTYNFKKGTIYKANISAPADAPIGYELEIDGMDNFFLSTQKGGKLSQENMLI